MLRFINAVEEVEVIADMFNGRGDRRKKIYRARCDLFDHYSDDEFRQKYRFSKEGAKYRAVKYASCLESGLQRWEAKPQATYFDGSEIVGAKRGTLFLAFPTSCL